MKKVSRSILVIILAFACILSSCDDGDTHPQNKFILDQPSEGGGDDDEDPIIIGDTTQVN